MQFINASIGIIFTQNKVLLSQRTPSQFMAGFWEFPGGKIEKNETDLTALKRELLEELGIDITLTTHLTNLTYKYPTKTVNLSVFIIKSYADKITAKEGQNLAWVTINKIVDYKVLPTVNPLLNFALLPKKYWITPEIHHQKWEEKFNKQLTQGIKLIQLRSKIDLEANFIKTIYQKCQKNQVKLLLNIPNFSKNCDGYHLTSKQLMQTNHKQYGFMSASVHNLSEAKKAENLGLDFIVLSPIKPTTSHPNTQPIGFKKAGGIATILNIPVYFLGGMSDRDLPQALKNNAQGIAGISLI